MVWRLAEGMGDMVGDEVRFGNAGEARVRREGMAELVFHGCSRDSMMGNDCMKARI